MLDFRLQACTGRLHHKSLHIQGIFDETQNQVKRRFYS